LSNRGYKYKYVAPLMSITPKKQKKNLERDYAMILNDNAIDYVH